MISKLFENRLKIVLTAFAIVGSMVGVWAFAHSGQTKNVSGDQSFVSIGRDTIPMQSKQSIRIMKKNGDEEVDMSIENGEVTDLIVNGEKIKKEDYDKYKDLIDENKPKSMSKSQMFFFSDGDDEMPFGHMDIKIMIDSMMKGFGGNFSFDDDFEGGFPALRDKMREFHWFGDDDMDFEMEMDSSRSIPGKPKVYKFDIEKEFNTDNPRGDHDNRMRLREKENTFSEIIGDNLNKDGLLIPGKTNSVELTGKYLKINGEKQPNNIWQKYMRIFEETAGIPLEKNSKLKFNFEGKESKRKFRVY